VSDEVFCFDVLSQTEVAQTCRSTGNIYVNVRKRSFGGQELWYMLFQFWCFILRSY